MKSSEAKPLDKEALKELVERLRIRKVSKPVTRIYEAREIVELERRV